MRNPDRAELFNNLEHINCMYTHITYSKKQIIDTFKTAIINIFKCFGSVSLL